MSKIAQKFPRHLFLEIVNFCNAGCRLCDYSRLSNVSRKHSFMSLKAIEKIAEQIGEREIDIYFQSGEPLLHPSFTEITRLIKQACPHSRLHLTTNGSLLSRHSNFLDNLFTISFSIDGFWDTSAYIRCLPGQKDEIKHFLSVISSQQPATTSWGVSLVIQADNVDEIEDYCRYWILQNAHFINIIHPHGTSREHADAFNRLHLGYTARAHHWDQEEVNKIDLHQLQRQLSKVSSIAPQINIYPDLAWDDLIEFYKGTLRENVLYCKKPWRSLEIFSNGAIVLSNLCADLQLGNIFNDDTSIAQCWQGPMLADFREKLKQWQTFPICQRCCGYNL